MSTTIDRRRFLTVLGGATAGLAATGRLAAPSAAHAANDPGPFGLGVASGDPGPESVVLWTRLGPEPRTAPVDVRLGARRRRALPQAAARAAPSSPAPRTRTPSTSRSDRPAAGPLVLVPLHRARARPAASAARARCRAGREPSRCASPSPPARPGSAAPYPAYRDMAEQDARPRPAPRRLHLRDRERLAGGVPPAARAVQDLARAARRACALPVHRHLGRPRGAEQLRGRDRGRRRRRPPVPRAARERLPGLLRAPAAAPRRDARRARRAALPPASRWGRLAEFSVLDGRQYRSDQPCGDPFIGPVCGEEDDPDAHDARPDQERWLLDGLRALEGALERARPADDHGPVRLRPRPGRVARARRLGRLPRRARADPRRRFARAATSATRSCSPATGTPTGSTTSTSTARTVATEFAGTSISSGCGWDATVRLGLRRQPAGEASTRAPTAATCCCDRRPPSEWRTDLRIVTDAARRRVAGLHAGRVRGRRRAARRAAARRRHRDRARASRGRRRRAAAQRAGRGARRAPGRARGRPADRRRRRRERVRAARAATR